MGRRVGTWGIGHGCAAGWDTEPNQSPRLLYADVMPAVQTPRMTPDIMDASGNQIQLSMRTLAALPDDGQTAGCQSLTNLATEYANRHLLSATACLDRINGGLELLKTEDRARKRSRVALECVLAES